MTDEYAAALETIREATRKFQQVTVSYRNQTIGDEEYLAARKEYKAAEATFDQVYAGETNRS